MNGRVYDSSIGRFLSADTIIQAPHDSQSYNRYSYVRNNPLVFTDPTGNSWLSKLWKKVKKYIRTIVAVVVAVVIAVYAPYLLAQYGGVAFGATVAGSTTLTFAGTVAVGALAGFASGAIITGSFKGAMQGALWGGLSAGLLYGVSSGTASLFKADIKLSVTKLMKAGMHKAAAFKSIANGLSRGLIAKLQGGSFKRSFLMSVGSSALRALYAKSVKYETDASWKPGKGLSVSSDNEIGVYDTDEGDKIPFGKNIFGNNDLTSPMRQGSFISNLGNAFPGGAAISRVHDAWLHPFYSNITENIYTNIGLMLPAAAVSYGALYHRYIDQIQMVDNMKRWR